MNDIFILTLFGGIALLLYGMKLAGEGLQKAGGMRLKNLLFYLTANRLIGVGVGVLLTLFLQSSNATLLMLLGLASSGALKLSQAIGIILGAISELPSQFNSLPSKSMTLPYSLQV